MRLLLEVQLDYDSVCRSVGLLCVRLCECSYAFKCVVIDFERYICTYVCM